MYSIAIQSPVNWQFSPDRLVEIARTRLPELYGDSCPEGLERLLNQASKSCPTPSNGVFCVAVWTSHVAVAMVMTRILLVRVDLDENRM